MAPENIHLDVASCAKSSRPKLDLVLQLLREGDILKVTRLSRPVLHLITLGAELRGRGVGLHVIEQASTDSPKVCDPPGSNWPPTLTPAGPSATATTVTMEEPWTN